MLPRVLRCTGHCIRPTTRFELLSSSPGTRFGCTERGSSWFHSSFVKAWAPNAQLRDAARRGKPRVCLFGVQALGSYGAGWGGIDSAACVRKGLRTLLSSPNSDCISSLPPRRGTGCRSQKPPLLCASIPCSCFDTREVGLGLPSGDLLAFWLPCRSLTGGCIESDMLKVSVQMALATCFVLVDVLELRDTCNCVASSRLHPGHVNLATYSTPSQEALVSLKNLLRASTL